MNRARGFCVELVLSVTMGTLIAQASVASNDNGACALVTEAELQSALSSKVTLQPLPTSDVQMCKGQGQSARVLIRTFTRSKDLAGNAEKAGIEAVKKMGAQVDVKTSGGITCMTVVPPPSKAALGYNTTCTVTSKAPNFAVIEVVAKTQQDMVPMERLRPVAEKMAGRL
jgi:hypothetical protein